MLEIAVSDAEKNEESNINIIKLIKSIIKCNFDLHCFIMLYINK